MFAPDSSLEGTGWATVPEARHVKAQDKVLGAIGFERESREGRHLRQGAFEQVHNIKPRGKRESIVVPIRFDHAVPPGLGRLFSSSQDFVLGFHMSCLRHSGLNLSG